MKIFVKEEVYGDLTGVVKWYESQSGGLGLKFLDEWEKTLILISRAPDSYQVKYKKFRQAKIKQFPHLVVFEIESKQVIIYAVIHGHRDPRSRYLRK